MSNANSLVIVITTVETTADAELLASALIEQSLAACVQIDGPIKSHYRWAGKVEQATEFRLMIKTTQQVWPRLKEKLANLHPYEEPQIIMLPVADETDGYRNWVIDQTT
ncbi:MAG: divalent-cation tolerance protein CutA [Rubripirellula sp.]